MFFNALVRECSKNWQHVYNACFNTIKDNTYIWFQYRIIQRILGINHFLKKIKVTNTDLCRTCEQAETLVHLFSECEKVCDLWYNVKAWIRSKIKVNLILTSFRLH